MSQTSKIENHLRGHPREWITLTVLVELSGAYAVHSRIAGLRKKAGMNIENKMESAKLPNGDTIRVSCYRYLPESAPVHTQTELLPSS